MKELIVERTCRICGKLKSIEEFAEMIDGRHKTMCIECENNGDKYAKEDIESVHQFLKLCGWRYSEKTKQWYKSGVKNKYGVWARMEKPSTRTEPQEIDIEIPQPKEKHQYQLKKKHYKYSYSKEYHREYWKLYYLLHRDELNAKRRKFPKKEKIVKPPLEKKIRKNNSKVIMKRWRDNNKEHLKAYRDSMKEYMKEYYKSHRDQILENKRRRRR